MAGVFSSQVITVAGRSLIASATATNQIVFVKALSATTVPADPSQTSGYDGVQGTITSSSATNNVARVVTSYNNATSNAQQPVKAIALMGRLASQSDAEAVIFAYCTDSGSEIYFPGNNAPEQITRFAYNIAFEGDAPLEVTEAGAASLSDLNRFVSLHVAGDPTRGEDQEIKGSKTFDGEVTLKGAVHMSANIVPTKDSTYKIGDSASRLTDVYTKTLHAGVILHGEVVSPDEDIAVGSSISPEYTSVTNGISSLSVGAIDARFNTVYAGTVNGVNLELGEVHSSNKATLTFKEDALLTDKDIVPANNTNAIQSCGRVGRPWKELYVKNAIYLTKGTSSTTNNLVIYEDDGGINLEDSYTGGDAGIFRFRKKTGGSISGATVSAGEFIGANPTISRASVSVIPESEVVQNVYDGDVVTIPEEIEMAVSYFNENYNTKISVAQYAESLHISTNWFIRNFKQHMKISPAQYLLSLRMVNAQSLLENTDYSVGEIAEIVGYDNQLYFSRVFKKEYGVSPAQYRKRAENQSAAQMESDVGEITCEN